MHNTTFFYAPPSAVAGDTLCLSGDEAHHAARVLRVRPGDEIEVVDGEGGWYRVVLDHVDRRTAAGHVVERRREAGEPPFALTVGLGLLKSRSRFETFLEKAVELGVNAVVPLVTDRVEKVRVNAPRAERIVVAAMKQSRRSRLVRLEAPCNIVAALDRHTFDAAFICHEALEEGTSLLQAMRDVPRAAHVCVLVGPEGGFTDEEVEQAVTHGATAVRLGPRRLRAETAAIVAAATVMQALEG